MPLDAAATTFDLPGGTIMGGDLASVKAFTSLSDPYFKENVQESIARGFYDGDWQKHPWEEETVPTAQDFDANGKYSWLKAPRFEGKPMQVGPLAQMLVGYAQGHEGIVNGVNGALDLVSTIAGTKVGPDALFGTLGRHAARAVRCSLMADLTLKHWDMLVDNIGSGDLEIFNPPTFPKGEQKGVGVHEAPRGLLSHWIVIQDGKIKNYQCVVPVYLERRTTRCPGSTRTVRSVPAGQSDRRPGTTARGSADYPLLRSVYRLCRAHAGSGRP